MITLLTAGLASHASHAYAKEVELFRCGSLGRVKLTSTIDKSGSPSSNTYKAKLLISSQGIAVNGVIHSFMGGNDRTFTRLPSDNYRNPDETSNENPFTLSVVSGYVYGKKREQITIYTLNEAKTCIREN